MKIHLWLNGKEISDEISPDMPLLEYVRTKGCYSVKRGCETSNCGLCTVWMNKKPVLSCSVLAARADGKEIVTLEGVCRNARQNLELILQTRAVSSVASVIRDLS